MEQREMFRRSRFERWSPKRGLLFVSEGSNGDELEVVVGEDRWLVCCTVSRRSYIMCARRGGENYVGVVCVGT